MEMALMELRWEENKTENKNGWMKASELLTQLCRTNITVT